MRTIIYNGHTIEVKAFGTEKVFYDGKEVSRKNSFFGAPHNLRVREDRKEVQYEVKIGIKFIWWLRWFRTMKFNTEPTEKNTEKIYSVTFGVIQCLILGL